MSRLPIEAVVLDMDGLLMDTEPVWRVAEVAVFTALGVELTEEELMGSMGQTIAAVVPVWRLREPAHGVGARRLTDVEVQERIIEMVAAEVAATGVPMPGVTDAIALLRRLGLPVAIASGSPPRMIEVVTERLDLGWIEVRCSAMDEPRSKPAPDVYLTAARRLGVRPERCVAIEDSPSGVLSAKAAGMLCIAVPDPLMEGDPAYAEADLVLGALTELDEGALRSVGTGNG
ncbi:MAG: HAD-IA family hydrolase [Candidatus Dormibacteria bacterium]